MGDLPPEGSGAESGFDSQGGNQGLHHSASVRAASLSTTHGTTLYNRVPAKPTLYGATPRFLLAAATLAAVDVDDPD